MNHFKTFGSLALAAASLIAFSSYASAAVLTSPSGTEYTGEIRATLSTPNSALIKAGIEATCGESTVSGILASNGSSSAGASGGSLSFGDCTKTVSVLGGGSVSIATGGAVTAIGGEVTIFDLGVSCVYGGGTFGTKIGTLKGGTPAVLEASAGLPKVSGGFLCASTGTFTGKYTVTTPFTLLVD